MICLETFSPHLRNDPHRRDAFIPGHLGFNIPRVDCSQIKVGIIDTGVPLHRDMPNVHHCKNSVMVDGCGVFDEDGHATAVSGLLCADMMMGIRGMCPEATFMFSKCMNSHDSSHMGNLAASLLWCLGSGCDVVVCSLFARDKEHLASAIIKKMVSKDIIIVAAVPDNSNYAFPADEEDLLSVSVGDSFCISVDPSRPTRLVLPNWSYDCFARGDKFCDMQGSSFANSAVAGCVVNMVANGIKRNARGIVRELLENKI
jgi:hypothetical protein